MWIPRKLKIERFLSHEKSEFVFHQGQATMIYGLNEDDEGQESNGSGKSAVIEGIAVSLTANPFRDVNMVDMIMNGEDSCEVNFELINTIDDLTMNIERKFYRSKNKSSEVHLYLNKEEEKLSSVDEKNKYILELLDIPKEDLINYFIVSKDNYTSFFHTGDVKKKEIIARFSGANILNGVEKLVSRDVDLIDSEIAELDKKKSSFYGKIEVYSDQLDELEKVDFEEERKGKVSNFEKTILYQKESIKRVDEESKGVQLQVDELKKKSQLLNESLQKFKVIDYSKEIDVLSKELKQHELEQKDVRSSLSEAEDLYAQASKNIKGSVKCPKCHHEFSISDSSVDIKEAREIIEEVTLLKSELEVEIQAFREKINKTQREVQEYQDKIRLHESSKLSITREFNSVEREIENLETKLCSFDNQKKRCNQEILSIEAQIEATKKEIFDQSKTTSLLERIEVLNKEAKVVDETILEKHQEKATIDRWSYLFKKFQSHLANSAVQSIESYTNYYLENIKSNLNISLDGFKVKADGKLSEKITATVLRNGINCGLFDKFSGGEKVRIDICCILALQKLINLNSKSGGLDLLCLDEIIESVDGLGAESILYALNGLNQTIEVITHTNFSKSYPNVITVRKKNQISEILS